MTKSGNSASLFDDSIIMVILSLVVTIVIIVISVIKFEPQISSFTIHLGYYLIWPINKLLIFVRSEGLNYFPALATGQLENNYMFARLILQRIFLYYSPLIILTGCWLIYRSLAKNPSRLVTGKLSRDDIWAINAYNFTSSLPTYGRKIEASPTFSGEWRLPYSPVMYCARHQILEIYTDNKWQPYPFDITRTGHLSRQYAADHEWRLNLISLKRQFKKDLGSEYVNLDSMISLSPVYAALLYIFTARIIFGRDFGYLAQDTINGFFATIKQPTFIYPVPRIKPLPITSDHLGKRLLDRNIVKETFDMIDLNQSRIDFLRMNLTALSEYYNVLRQGGTAKFIKPEKMQSLIILEEQFAKNIKKTLNFSSSIELSDGEGEKWAEKEIEKINLLLNQMVDFDLLMKSHAYCNTLIYRLYVEATRNGVFTTADFIWLRPLDQTLFFALNNKGREASALIDGAAIHFHALCEMRVEKPLLEPDFASLIQGVEYEVNEFFHHEY